MTEICRISDVCSGSKFELKIFSLKCLVPNHVVTVTL